MTSVGSRLRAERERVKLSQTAFAAACGAGKRMQIYFEQGQNLPGGDYLLRAASLGVDVQYVLTGLHSPNAAKVAAMTITVTGNRNVFAGRDLLQKGKQK